MEIRCATVGRGRGHGPGATSLAAGRADVDAYPGEDGEERIVALFGPLSGGALLHVGFSDPASLPPVSVVEVAGSDGVLRTDLTVYTVSVSPR